MWIYFLFFFWILLYFVNPKLARNRGVLFFFLGLFLCTGYMVGSDWVNYELDYGLAARGDIIDERKEPGYYFFRAIFARMGIGFWPFHIITKLICYTICIKFLLKYTGNNYVWGLLYMFSHVYLDYFINCPFRSLIAGSILLVGINQLIRDKKLNYLLLSVLAASFHYSILLIAPLVYIVYKVKKIVPWKIVIVSSLAVYLLFFFFWQIGVAEKLLVYQALLFGDSKSVYYLMEQGSVFSIGMWAVLIYYLWIVMCIKQENLTNSEIFIYNLSYMYMLFFVGSFFIPILSRFALYLTLPFGCLLSFGLVHVKKSRIKSIAVFSMILFLGLSMRSALTKDSRYVPYSSYLQYIFTDKPSYEERVNYNATHSPYKGKDEGVRLME